MKKRQLFATMAQFFCKMSKDQWRAFFFFFAFMKDFFLCPVAVLYSMLLPDDITAAENVKKRFGPKFVLVKKKKKFKIH